MYIDIGNKDMERKEKGMEEQTAECLAKKLREWGVNAKANITGGNVWTIEIAPTENYGEERLSLSAYGWAMYDEDGEEITGE